MSIVVKFDRFLAKTGLRKALVGIFHIWEDMMNSGIVERNSSLRNRYCGERCFILGNATSLNEIDFNQLDNEYTFGCSNLFYHKNACQLNLSFYADLEPFYNAHYRPFVTRFVRKYFWTSVGNTWQNPNARFFVRVGSRRFLEKNGLLKERKVHYIKSLSPMLKASKLINNLSERITFTDGSIYFMIAAAIYMGFKELYLCGSGYTYKPRLNYHFYDEYPNRQIGPWKKPIFSRYVPEKERNEMIHKFADERGLDILKVRQEGDYDVVTFTKNDTVDERHRIMNRFAESKGVKIYNVVPDGFESPVYEKVSFEELIRRISNH